MEKINAQDILNAQRDIYTTIDKLFINMKKDGAERKTPTYFKTRLDTLERYWREFEDNHEQLQLILDESHDYLTGTHYEHARALYKQVYEYISSFKMVLPKRTDENPTPTTSHEPPNPFVVPVPTFTSEGTNSKLDDMMKKQTCNFRAINRTLKTIDLDKVEEKWELEDILKTLNARWNTIDSQHWEIDGETNGSNQVYESTFMMMEKKYNQMKKAINSKLWSVGHRETSTPRLEIPVFNGNYNQWMSFKDLFIETIHKNPTLSNAQKMQFLKSKVKGEAERLIKHLNISSDNYEVSWEILNHRYNNKKLIFSSLANTLLNHPTAQHASIGHIKKLHDTTKECLNAIGNLGVDVSSWDPLIVHILSQKLDPETNEDYMTSLNKPRDLPYLDDFLDFLELKFTTMESSRRKQESGSTKSNSSSEVSRNKKQNSNNKSQQAASHKSYQTSKLSCPICQQNDHAVYYCPQFLDMIPAQRHKTITKLNLCPNCLNQHTDKKCTSKKKCRDCNQLHNTLLHEAFAKAATSNSIPTGVTSRFTPGQAASNATTADQPSCPNFTSNVTQREIPEVLLATAMIKVQGSDGSEHMMRALIDQGSQTSLITENAAQQLGIRRHKCKGVITGIGAKNNNCKGLITISCKSANNKYEFRTDVLIMKSLTNNLPSHTFSQPTWEYLKHIELADPEFYISRPIDILFGADIYSNIIMGGICRADQSNPIAQQTKLGWILCGNMKTLQCNVVLNKVDEIQKFWEIEDISDETSLSSEDDECIKFYKSSTQRLLDGKYVVKLPLKSDFESKLGQSKHIAVAQLKQLERKFSKNHIIEHEYKLFIDEYLSLGHMKPCTGYHELECYLPHHCVLREGSSTTSLRVVFNASGKTSNGTSLNDFLYKGPNLQKDLQSLILTWRQYRIGFTADIEKMFRQIWLHHDHQPLQKIIWRNTPLEPVQEFQLATVTYGTKPAPFLAMMTLKQLAEDERDQFQEASQVLESSFYMDDLVYGSHTTDSAKNLKHDLINLLKSGGFNLRKWASNDPELILNTNGSQHQTSLQFKSAESTSTKTLGLNWDPTRDIFFFQSKIESEKGAKITKRSLLSDISKIFDPLGWLTPITTKLKLIFQSVWTCSLQWDDNLPDEIISEWSKIRDQIENINQVQVPRWLGIQPTSSIEIHGFCDASTKAYGCVIYCKVIQEGQAKVTLIVGKARLVPLNKSVTLPRLELCGALLLSRMMNKVRESLSEYDIKVYGWTDSTAVPGWLQGNPSRWKTFVSNRVKQVTQTMPAECWNYVKSAENPADCTSRGLLVNQLLSYPLWWNGPAWLPKFKSEDKNHPIFETNEEIRVVKTTHVAQIQADDSIITRLLKKNSSLSKVVRILSWIRRFTTNKQIRKHDSYLTLQEINEAKALITKQIQLQAFQEEIVCLRTNQDLPFKSSILKLNPVLDNSGILRVGGRLNNAHISPEMKQPMILPHESRFTELVIDHAHLLTFHGGARLTTSLIRQRYWIIGGNRAVKKRLRLCVTCRKQKPELQSQIMGDLPTARVNPSRPFSHTGVDFTGHVSVKASKGRGIKTSKGYVAIFVCMVTKAVHLELVSDLTTSSLIAALRRMAARKRTPQHIYSDNGRNFLGASRVLKQEYQELQEIFIDDFMIQVTEMQIHWHFNAPAWPTAGGLWEAAVKSFKFHLKRFLGEQALTFEEFSTLLAQIEACLNSRPLCPLTEDPEDLNFLKIF